MGKILKYKNYITPGGGVTASGGEPLLQVPFLIELFKRLKNEGIHTCIDTSGMFPISDELKELVDLTDLFLLDIKHIDDKKCKDLVGVSNKLELECAILKNKNKIYISDIGEIKNEDNWYDYNSKYINKTNGGIKIWNLNNGKALKKVNGQEK